MKKSLLCSLISALSLSPRWRNLFPMPALSRVRWILRNFPRRRRGLPCRTRRRFRLLPPQRRILLRFSCGKSASKARRLCLPPICTRWSPLLRGARSRLRICARSPIASARVMPPLVCRWRALLCRRSPLRMAWWSSACWKASSARSSWKMLRVFLMHRCGVIWQMRRPSARRCSRRAVSGRCCC